jgi:hypothetical protein
MFQRKQKIQPAEAPILVRSSNMTSQRDLHPEKHDFPITSTLDGIVVFVIASKCIALPRVLHSSVYNLYNINQVAIYSTIRPSTSLQKFRQHRRHVQIPRGNHRSRNIHFFIKACIDIPQRVPRPGSRGIDIPLKKNFSPKKSISRAVAAPLLRESRLNRGKVSQNVGLCLQCHAGTRMIPLR